MVFEGSRLDFSQGPHEDRGGLGPSSWLGGSVEVQGQGLWEGFDLLLGSFGV